MQPDQTFAELIAKIGVPTAPDSVATQLHATGAGRVRVTEPSNTSEMVIFNPTVVWNGYLSSPEWLSVRVEADDTVQLGITVGTDIYWAEPYVAPVYDESPQDIPSAKPQKAEAKAPSRKARTRKKTT